VPLPVDEALYQTWKDVVGDLRRIVSREEGSRGGAGAARRPQVGEPAGRLPRLGGMLERPKDIVIDLGQLAERGREDVGMTETALKDILGDYYVRDMKASPLVGRLKRMKAEADRGQETMGRKLRYLFWLN